MPTKLGSDDPTPATARQRHGRAAVRFACAIALAFGAAPAQAPLANELVVRAASQHLDSSDPVARGEAALLVAIDATPAREARLLALAVDPAPATRRRARIALGLCGTPAAIAALARMVASDDDADDRIAAAFGLGLASGPDAETTIAAVLVGVVHGSWKRNRDLVVALLLGMERDPSPTATAALRHVLDDDANRDPDVRALMAARVVRFDRSLDDKALRRLLQRARAGERTAILTALADTPDVPLGGALLADLADAAAHDGDAGVRAAALAALARAHHLPALELAARAVRVGAPVEARAAMRCLRRLGGVGMLRAAAPLVAAEDDAERAEALLDAFDAPPPPQLLDRCRELATDGRKPWSLRAAAAALLARAEPAQGAVVLRELFRLCRDARVLPRLAAALVAAEREPTPLPRRFPLDTAPGSDPERWAALLRADADGALGAVTAALVGSPGAAPPRVALAACRAGRVLTAPTHPAAPAVLAEALRVD
jgi:hypothetical protein